MSEGSSDTAFSQRLRSEYIGRARKIVLKLGTRVLLSHHRDMNKERINKLADDVLHFKQKGYDFTIVTSGAVGFGMNLLGMSRRPTDLKQIQACASIGQSLLMQKWSRIFKKHDVNVGQILLTYDIIEDRRRFLYARDCLNALIGYGIIPIVNENDSVAVDELKFGDNDTLSALTSNLMDADLLVLFTDTDGVYDKNPKKHDDAKRIPLIEKIDDNLLSGMEDRNNDLSIGGMRSKLIAARQATTAGTAVVITDGFVPDLRAVLDGADIGTFIPPDKKHLKEKKKWIFFNHKIKGKVIIDDGAEEALIRYHKSLLPGGIVRSEKEFQEGSIVGIFNSRNKMIGKGITYYSSHDIELIKGQHTDQIESIIGKRFYEEIIHRDNMIII